MPRSRAPRTRAPRVPVESEVVLDEAARLFRVNGFHRTRMQDIAKSFGVSHAALYYHFSSKGDILAQLSLRSIRTLTANADEVVSRGGTAGEQLLGILSAHTAYMVGAAAHVATLVEHELEIPAEQFELVSSLRRTYIDRLEDRYREGVHTGELPDVPPPVAVSILLGACNWVGHWDTGSGPTSVPELVAQTRTFLSGIVRPAGHRTTDVPAALLGSGAPMPALSPPP